MKSGTSWHWLSSPQFSILCLYMDHPNLACVHCGLNLLYLNRPYLSWTRIFNGPLGCSVVCILHREVCNNHYTVECIVYHTKYTVPIQCVVCTYHGVVQGAVWCKVPSLSWVENIFWQKRWGPSTVETNWWPIYQ